MNTIDYTADNLINHIESNKIAVYCAGFVATRFYEILEQKGLEKQISCFIVSQGAPGEYLGVPVKTYKEYKESGENGLICIACHEVNKVAIERILNADKNENYIWIYPYLWEMCFSQPLAKGKVMPIKDLWEAQEYRIKFGVLAPKYLAIKEYYGENNIGFDIYRRMMIKVGDFSTVNKRLELFKQLIASVEQNGFDKNKSLYIMRDNRLIDGNHRFSIALAKCHSSVVADVFQVNEQQYDIQMNKSVISPQEAFDLGIKRETIKQLENAVEEMNSIVSKM